MGFLRKVINWQPRWIFAVSRPQTSRKGKLSILFGSLHPKKKLIIVFLKNRISLKWSVYLPNLWISSGSEIRVAFGFSDGTIERQYRMMAKKRNGSVCLNRADDRGNSRIRARRFVNLFNNCKLDGSILTEVEFIFLSF